MAEIIRKRLTGKEEGFTLIELLVVIVILGILMAIAVPSYLGFQTRAKKAAAQANIRAALPSIEAYYGDNGTYVGMTVANLQASYDAGLRLSNATTAPFNAGGIISVSATSFCITDIVGTGNQYYLAGPAASVTTTACT
jgi:type IV pilus assembly protein PilA